MKVSKLNSVCIGCFLGKDLQLNLHQEEFRKKIPSEVSPVRPGRVLYKRHTTSRRGVPRVRKLHRKLRWISKKKSGYHHIQYQRKEKKFIGSNDSDHC